ncbi:response regulator transcription factor [Streptomyces sp. DSM 44918]|uniref:Response regulator transcription factor n=1 Tax=Streptomyces millisiae TaxID=3075542 RepID=A0ABU2LXQ6_9ACTN|nr:response regulator transcription factor [Streptomyces sp. DSM 44918]MDT0322376.1 response regulator transcription factor [Streptomyces sp. DSM 44918]
MRSSFPGTDVHTAVTGRPVPGRQGQRGRPEGRIRVTVHAPDPISREGARGQLRRRPEIELREESETEPGTVALLISDVLDDAAVTRLRRLINGGRTRAVLVVGSLRDAKLLDVLGCGIGAIVWRHEATEDRLARAVMAAARGDGELPADLLGRLIDQVNVLHGMAAARAGAPTSGLSPREVDVLRLVADGLGTSEIAAKLSYSDRTIKNILHELSTRLHLRNRAHAVAYALREGYI